VDMLIFALVILSDPHIIVENSYVFCSSSLVESIPSFATQKFVFLNFGQSDAEIGQGFIGASLDFEALCGRSTRGEVEATNSLLDGVLKVDQCLLVVTSLSEGDKRKCRKCIKKHGG
jgi:hypothetical protein